MKQGYLHELKKTKEKKIKTKLFWRILGPSVFVILFIYAFFFSGAFELYELNVLVSPEGRVDIKDSSSKYLVQYLNERILGFLPRRNNIFLINKDKINSFLLGNIYQINDVEISKGIFKKNFLTVELSLKEKVGVWCGDSGKKSDDEPGTCFKFDAEGSLF